MLLCLDIIGYIGLLMFIYEVIALLEDFEHNWNHLYTHACFLIHL